MITRHSILGPNVKKLVCERAAQLQCDRAKQKYGHAGGAEVAAMLADDGVDGLKAIMTAAFDWVAQVLDIARRAPGSDKWPTDEDMAAEIVRGIEIRRATQKVTA